MSCEHFFVATILHVTYLLSQMAHSTEGVDLTVRSIFRSEMHRHDINFVAQENSELINSPKIKKKVEGGVLGGAIGPPSFVSPSHSLLALLHLSSRSPCNAQTRY